MKRIHRKVIALQARVARRISQEILLGIDEFNPVYQQLRGPNYDRWKAAGRARGAKDTKMAGIIREIVRSDKARRGFQCPECGLPGGHVHARLDGSYFNNSCVVVRTLVGPFNEGFIQEGKDGVLHIPD